ncbi:PEP/pyruvate-binding domain-containing protein [Actinoplanes sp. M2I2]|uniref:PEP/pyruvate-binding domain-containing protein n=1 Tax=Actinoplanes sp. M2I2 TaxID=1734444 RepID=UPI002020029D|nr:PEP/pyruvate-binding domain-containing protein [Actinoplanes sp. M2I2]
MIFPLDPAVDRGADVLGGKAHGLIAMMRLGLPVPAGFVVGVPAGRAFLRHGELPAGLGAARDDLHAEAVSVRSGAAMSMPGMMTTLLDVRGPITPAVRDVFASWNTPRARTYRSLHGIPHDLGTAVVVQRMVYGERGASGVAFSRDPGSGARVPYGDVLFGRRGDDVVSGRATTLPLPALREHEPVAWNDLLDALSTLEGHYRDACHVEFTIESGRLWLLQVRPGGLTARAAVRVAVDLADEGLIDRRQAVRRITPRHLRAAATPRMLGGDLVARGRGASPGVATGRIAVTADRAARMAADGPVILVRPETSPLDLHGLAAAAGIVTTRGGLASHAAVVARSLGRPAVVGTTELTVDGPAARAGHRSLPEGTVITIDGTSGDVALGNPGLTPAMADTHLHRLLTWADDISGDRSPRPGEQRLTAAHGEIPAGRDDGAPRSPGRSGSSPDAGEQ